MFPRMFWGSVASKPNVLCGVTDVVLSVLSIPKPNVLCVVTDVVLFLFVHQQTECVACSH